MNTTNADYYTFNTGSSLLLLGKSGSGKSVLCETLFKRFVRAKKPDELRFVVLDMTCHDAEILRDEHPECIEELVEGTHIEKAFEALEKYAELSKTGRPNEKSELLIFIEECDMARHDFNRYETTLKVLISNADSARMRLIYSTSVIAPQTVSQELLEAFDVVLVGHQYDSEARQYLGVPDTDDFPEYSFVVKEKESATV